MKSALLSLIALNLLSSWLSCSSNATLREDPTIFVSMMVRNKAHTLPYFLKLFEELDYPKDRMALWIKSDQNDDDSLEILNKWIPTIKDKYHRVFFDWKNHSSADGKIVTNWNEERFRHIINLKEEALEKARDIWADYAWFLDCDVYLNNNQTLKYMLNTTYPVVSPMLDSLSMYSNYWCGMGVDYYYRRTEEYKPIREREKKGCFKVILVHSCFLIDLRQVESKMLTFKPENINGYGGPHDDIITFAISGHWSDIPMYVCNQVRFGFIPSPLEDTQTIEDDYDQLVNMKVEASVFFAPMVPHPLLSSHVKHPPKDKLGFDEVFLINLERRPERLSRMEWAFNELGIDHKLLVATDGKALNDSYIESLGIRVLPNFADPYHKRAMTLGEIGCFLSHYRIWKEIIDRDLETTLIFEDDIRFEPHFRTKLGSLMNEVKELKVDWDLIYLGRKRLRLDNESWVEGAQQLSTVEYSYWTLSYVLTKRGAEKLLAADPFSRLVPVDEYLPIMFDKHPEARWKDAFPNRDLKAYSVAPLLVFPMRYVGEEGYVSDTEASAIIPDKVRLAQEEPQDKGAKEIVVEESQSVSPEAQLADGLADGGASSKLGEFTEVKHSEL